MRPTKRTFLVGGLLASAASAAAPARASAKAKPMTSIASDLETYIGFGVKASGGAGDDASGAWIERRLQGLGYAVERHGFQILYFEAAEARLSLGGTAAPVTPLLPVTQTLAAGLEGPLVVVAADAVDAAPFPAAAIVALVLPYRRWSTAVHPLIQKALAAVFARGAAAVVLVTTGPSEEAVALNVAPDAAVYPGPVGVMGPAGLATLLKARDGSPARLQLTGRSGMRTAFNVVAEKAGRGRRIAVSTPRSGWGVCAGERGPGVAAFLALAAWLAERGAATSLVCTSGHEFENFGGHTFLRERAPKPADVALWVHLGANLAARDWHEAGNALLPLPSADPQRFLMASEDLLPAVKAAFAGLPGLESPYRLSADAQGELKEIFAAGYTRALGIFGAHRYHHTAKDDARCVSADMVAPVVAALQSFVARFL
jgi:hypothetical protein